MFGHDSRLDINQEQETTIPIIAYICQERGQYPAIMTEQAWSIKDLLSAIRKQRDAVRNREETRYRHLARLVSKSHGAMWYTRQHFQLSFFRSCATRQGKCCQYSAVNHVMQLNFTSNPRGFKVEYKIVQA